MRLAPTLAVIAGLLGGGLSAALFSTGRATATNRTTSVAQTTPSEEPSPVTPVTAQPSAPAANRSTIRTEPVDAPEPPARPIVEAAARHNAVTVHLAADDLPADATPHLGRLGRELLRQSLLAVAREELGAVTRDGSLGETAARALRLRMEVRRSPDASDFSGKFVVTLRRADSPAGAPLLETTVEVKPWLERDPVALGCPGEPYDRLVAAAAGLSAEFAAALDRAGLDRPPIPTATAAGDDPRLRQMSYVPQFEAVRAAHRLPPGEAKFRRLSAAYANLSLLTSHLGSPASDVFAARALAYAERVPKNTAAGDEARAYAAALAGLHGYALQQSEALTKLHPDSNTDRLRAIDLYCRFRTRELTELSERSAEVRELAALLAYLSTDDTGESTLAAETHVAAIEANPDCYRAYDPNDIMPIGPLHQTTVEGIGRLLTALPQQLRDSVALPESARRALGETDLPLSPPQVAAVLEAADEATADEPSWRAFGGIVRDEGFALVFRRLSFMEKPWGVPTGDTYEELKPLVAGHRYAGCLEMFADHPDPDTIAAFVQTFLKATDLVPRQWRLGVLVPVTPRDARWSQIRHATVLADLTPDDLIRTFDGIVAGRPDSAALPTSPVVDAVCSASPHHPFWALTLARRTGTPPDALADIETRYGHRGDVLIALSKAHEKSGRTAETVRCLEKAAAVAPSFEVYYRLASVHRAAGREAEMLAATKKAFDYPCYGLNSTRALYDIARFYMERKNFASAAPYAYESAESGAGWAIVCAADCAEALGDWEAAEGWVKALSERYEGNAGNWYLWCRRTGRGDERAAWAAAEPWTGRLDDAAARSADSAWRKGLFEYARGKDAEAAKTFEKIATDCSKPAAAVIAAVGYLRTGRREDAVRVLAFGAGLQGDAATRAGVFHRSLTSGRPLDAATVAEFDKAIDGFSGTQPMLYRAVFGELLVRLGDREDGLRFLRRAAEAGPPAFELTDNAFERAFAAAWLRGHTAAGAATTEVKVQIVPRSVR